MAKLFHQQFGADTQIKLTTLECPFVEVSNLRANGFLKGLQAARQRQAALN
jgi:hypothetical protein